MIQEFTNIQQLADLWKQTEAVQVGDPFRSYDWECLVAKYASAKKQLFLVIDHRCIFPFEILRKEKRIVFLGEDSSSDYLGPAFSAISAEDIRQCVDYLRKKYPGYCLEMNRICPWNPSYAELEALVSSMELEKSQYPCVHVDLDRSKPFYDTLSKHTRQNYRTAVNRISKQELPVTVIYEERVLTAAEADTLFRLYVVRRDDVYSGSGQWLRYYIHRIIRTVSPLKASRDVMSVYAQNHPVCYGKIEISGEIAAYFLGIRSGRSIAVCRVATNKNYYEYSPGLVMFVKLLEEVKENTDVFDLTRGTESYKFQLGGTEHPIYNYRLQL